MRTKMYRSYLILCLMFNVASANISIDIDTISNSSGISINYSGADVKIVSDNEINIFGIYDENLEEALKKHYGRRPSNFYLKGPTPWGDLYKTYKWEQIKRVLSVKSAKLKGVTKNPVIILSQDFENSFTNPIKVNTGISQTVENTITTSWTRSKEIVLSQEVEYDVNILIGKVSGTTGFSYSTSWGESEERSETITIGTSSTVETELQPGQQATAVLTATRGFMEIEIIYKAFLRGNVAVNFKKPYKDHHFWGPPIENVMKSGGLENERTATEIIKIGFYADASLKVFDKVSKQPL